MIKLFHFLTLTRGKWRREKWRTAAFVNFYRDYKLFQPVSMRMPFSLKEKDSPITLLK